MKYGKWFLCYQDFDNHAGGMMSIGWAGLVKGQCKVPLTATTKRKALTEGSKKWKEVLSKGTYQGVDGGAYPHSPRVIYEILLPSS